LGSQEYAHGLRKGLKSKRVDGAEMTSVRRFAAGLAEDTDKMRFVDKICGEG